MNLDITQRHTWPLVRVGVSDRLDLLELPDGRSYVPARTLDIVADTVPADATWTLEGQQLVASWTENYLRRVVIQVERQGGES